MSWAHEFLQQLERFPRDDHDDYVDTFTQAMIRLRDMSMFDLPQADLDVEEDYDYVKARKRRRNPYAA